MQTETPRWLSYTAGLIYMYIYKYINNNISHTDYDFRIKLIMTQKVLTIKNLIKELNDTKLKCEHLEKLLDQQRRDYILKSL